MNLKTLRTALLLTLLLPMSLRAQDSLQVCNGTDENSYIPMYGYYNDSRFHNEFIYPARLLSSMAGQSITGMTFYASEDESWNSNLVIWIGETTDTAYASGTTWKMPADADTAWTGTCSVVNGRWVIQLDVPYSYQGGNLVIGVMNTAAGTGCPDSYFLGVETDYNASGYVNGGSAYSSTTVNYRQQFLPKVTFTYSAGGPVCLRPTNLNASNITTNAATVSWNSRNGESSWLMYLNDSLVSEVYDSTYTFAGLNPNTNYSISVSALCTTGDTSRRSYISFRTGCAPIATLPWNENFNSFTGSSSSTVNTSITTIPCWEVTGAYSNYSFLQNTYNHDTAATGNAMRLYGHTTNYPTFIALPEFQESISSLMLGFWMTVDATNTYLGVGYMTDPTDTSTYTEVATVRPYTTGNWEWHDAAMNSEATGRIAIRYYGNYGNIRLDDFTVGYAPSCSRPSSLAVRNVTSNAAELLIADTVNNASSYTVVLRDGTTTVDSQDVYDTVVYFTSLTPNTDYTVSLVTNCDDGNSYNPMYASFRTSCVAIAHDSLPFVEDFESYAAGGYSSSTNVMNISCWNVMNRYSNSYPYFSTSQHHSGNNSLYIYSYADTTTATVIALPAFEDDLQNLMLSFWLYNNAVQVGVLSNPTDASTFRALQTCIPSASSTWEQFETTFAGMTTGTIAIRYAGANYGSSYIDDITVQELPSCTRPSQVRVSEVTTTSATITISDANLMSHYMLYLSATDSVEIYDTVYYLTDLTSNTAYTISVRTICNDGSMTEAISTSFRTDCESIGTLPWHENFDSYSSLFTSYANEMVGGMIPCWGLIKDNASARMSLTNNNYRYGTTGISLMFYPGRSGAKNFIILPPFDDDISLLELQFQTRPEGTSASSGSFDVGYMTDPNDSTSFVSVQHYDYSDFNDSYQEKFVVFTDAPSGARMAMRHNSSASNYYWFVDEVDVHYAPACNMPTSVSITATTTTSLTATVTGDDYNTYCYLLIYNDSVVDSVEIADTTWTFENLTSNRLYTVNVRTVCADGTYTPAATTTGRTDCGTMITEDLPFVEDFESYDTYVYSFPCWTRNSYSTTYPNYPQTSSANGPTSSSTRVLYFYNYQGSQFLAMPPVENLNGLLLSFSARANSTSNTYFLNVGTMTDPNDSTTFTNLQTFPLNGEWTLYDVNLSNYTDTAHYLAFRFYSNAYAGIYVDDIMLGVAPSCPRPAGIALRSVDTNSAVIFIDDTAAINNYTVVVATDSVADTIHATDTLVTLSGLTPNTAYTVTMTAHCADGYSHMPYTLQFTTPCTPFDSLPWIEGFESLPLDLTNDIPCWSYIPNGHSSSKILVTNASTRVHSGTKSLRFNGNCQQPNYALLPSFNANTSSLVLRLWLVAESGASSGALRVGYMTNPADSSTFVPTAVFNASNYTDSMRYEEVFFIGAPADARIAISQLNNGANYWWWIDDVELDFAPNCAAPVITVTDIAETTATVNLTDANNTNHYWLFTSPTDSVEVTGSTHNLTGLSASTVYTLTAKTICGTSMSNSSSCTFRTACGAIAHSQLPWNEDFEGYTGGTYASATCVFDDPCWTVLNRYSNNYPYIYNSTYYAHSGSQSFNFYGSPIPATVVALPSFADSLSNLAFSFWMRTSSTSYGVEVGYMTDPNDASTFTSIQTCHVSSSNTYTTHEVTFPATATGNIALRYVGTYSSSIYLDDFSVFEAPSCARPTSVTVGNITPYSAELTIVDTAHTNHYQIVANGADTTEIFADTVTLTGLTPATHYSVAVKTICSDGTTTSAVMATFQTPCVEITTLPWSENFDSIPTGTSNIYTGAYLPCWSMHRGRYNDSTGTSPLYRATMDVFYLNTYGMDGSKNLRCNIYGDTNYRWLITPTFTLATPAEFSFHYSLTKYNSNNAIDSIGTDDRFLVLASTNGGATWTKIYSFGHGSDFDVQLDSVSATADSVAIDLTRFIGQNVRIAFYGESFRSNTDNDFHIDNLRLISTGLPPVRHTVTLVSSDESMGSVSPAGATQVNQNTSFTATANAAEGYHFVSWTNGSTVVSHANPYTFIVSADITLTAQFEMDTVKFAVTLAPADETMGTVRPNGTTMVPEGDYFTATAVPNNGFRFEAWTNGTDTVSTENPYTFIVDREVSLTAAFVKVCRLDIDADLSMGIVTGQGTYDAGSQVTVTATPDPGYSFYGWVFDGTTDTVTSNPYTFTIYDSGTLHCLFGPTVSIDETTAENVTLSPNPATTSVTIAGLEEDTEVTILDASGREMFRTKAQAESLNVNLHGYAQGAYFVRIASREGLAVRKLIVK